MNIEDQVTSLELSKRLYELEVKQDGFFSWYYQKHDEENNFYYGKDGYFEIYYGVQFPSKGYLYYSAFTASELLELLPREIDDDIGFLQELILIKRNQYYCVEYYTYNEIDQIDKNPSNALAKMLIHLIENNLWEIK
jgi:hypothetical protein